MDNCIFCKIARGEIPAQIVYEDSDVVAFEDLNPQAPTHVLVIPRRHISRVSDAKESDALLLGKLTLAANQIAAERGIVEGGYRLVMNCNEGAGQSVWHIHLHLLGGRNMQWPPG
ncbi:MAG: histidine triad nucleotide-binding protein [Armatimonadetes bacterium]|nr:histidine triad nucleotide-binding protein [Armatimonadota bacterium]